MLNGFNTRPSRDDTDFHQRVADQSIQNIDERQEQILQAKGNFIGALMGIILGGVVTCFFLGPSHQSTKEQTIPVIRRPITPAKVLPNEPGGMEIDNQDRDIYHIIDNLPKEETEVHIMPVPEVPNIVVERNIEIKDNLDNLVESIEEEGVIENIAVAPVENDIENVKVARVDLTGVQTNSREKIIIPAKIKNIDVSVQNTIKHDGEATAPVKVEVKKEEVPVAKPQVAVKGSWYAQIIASSSREAVENLWKSLSSKHSFLKSYPYEIEEITSANGSVLYRLKVGSFKTRQEAVVLSDKLQQNKISSIIKQN